MDSWDIKYDTLSRLLKAFTDSEYIRVYSDESVTISAYIKNRQVSINGDYYMVLTCVEALHTTFKNNAR